MYSMLIRVFINYNDYREYIKSYQRAKYYDEAKPWAEQCDMAFPCATQNELNHSDAIALVNGGCRFLIEGRYLHLFSKHFILFYFYHFR